MKNISIIIFAFFSCIAVSQTAFSTKNNIDPNTGDNPFVLDTGFIDEDTFVDIIIGTDVANELKWYKNNGDGTFSLQQTLTTSLSAIGGLVLVDVNGDSFLDAVSAGFSSDQVVWFANDGFGNYGAEQTVGAVTGGAGFVAHGDVDNNTFDDIIVTGYFSNTTVWFANDGTGNFTGPNTIDDTLDNPGAIDLNDIDDDGDLDAVIITATGSGSVDVIEIFRNNLIPSGTVSFSKDANPVDTGLAYGFSVKFANIDGDENLDILAADLEGDAVWYEENDAMEYDENILSTSIANPAIITAADLDNDGNMDVILSNGQGEAIQSGNTDLSWYLNNGDGTLGTEQVIDTSQSQVYDFDMVDLDNDGDLDIATVSYNQDDVNWFENDASLLSIPAFTSSDITLFPNPVTTQLYIKGLPSGNHEILITDISGRFVKKSVIDDTVNLSNLSSGIYILHLTELNLTAKFVKK